MQTRLTKKLEHKTKKQLMINILATAVVLFLFAKFGIPFLLNMSLFFSSQKQQTNTTQTKGNQFLLPPILTEDFTATNSASISLNGTAQANTTVRLFVDNDYVDTSKVNNDGTFVFGNVSLHDGQNTFTAKIKKGIIESDFSDPLVITLQLKAPNLTIDFPSDGQSFSKDDTSITVRGKTDPDDKVTVNDFWAISDDKGNYSYTMQLKNGDNQIKVDSVDGAGNKTEKTIKVTSSQ